MLVRLVGALALCLATVPALAIPGPPELRVEYSADRTIHTEKGDMTGRVYATQHRERVEMNMRGTQSVMIIRRDLKSGTMLIPAQRIAMELDFAQAERQAASGPPPGGTVRKVGSEKIEGIATTKYEVIRKDSSSLGFVWVSRDGIVMKMDMQSEERGRGGRVVMTLKNLKIGPQPASLFEVPPGYRKMSGMGGFGMPPAAPTRH